MPRRPSISAPPLATSRSTQSSSVGNRPKSPLASAVWTFGFGPAAVAAGTGGGGGRGPSRARRCGGMKLFDRLAQLGKLGGRFGLRLLDLIEAVVGPVELCDV